MPAEIILLRHGQIIQSSPRRFVGQSNIPLDETGRRQAEAVRRHLAGTDIIHAAASDLERTMETASIVCRGRELEIEPESNLREINLGAWEGLTKEEVERRFPGEHAKRGLDMAGYRPENGESFKDLQDRALPAFLRTAAAAAAEENGVVLVTAHAGVNRVLLCGILGLPLGNLFRLGQDYCGLNRIVQDKGQWVVESMNLCCPPAPSCR